MYLNRFLILILLRDLIIWITYKLFFCSGTYHKNFFILIHIKKLYFFVFTFLSTYQFTETQLNCHNDIN